MQKIFEEILCTIFLGMLIKGISDDDFYREN
jgi:hypothetical protein